MSQIEHGVARFATVLAAAIFVALLLVGCAQYTAVKPAESRVVGDALQVRPQMPWSAFQSGHMEVWTVNGIDLQSITYLTGIEDGKPLFDDLLGEDPPSYRAGMRASDIVDLFEASLRAASYSQIEVTNLRPARVGEQSGFRFDYSAFDRRGLAKRGMVVGFKDASKRLTVVLYEAADEHYFDAFRAEAETVLSSIEPI